MRSSRTLLLLIESCIYVERKYLASRPLQCWEKIGIVFLLNSFHIKTFYFRFPIILECYTLVKREEFRTTFERKNVKHREEFAKSLIQLSVLSQILGLGDLNSENVGFDENTAAPYIVDFQTSFIDSSVIFEDINHPKTVMSPVYKLKMNLGQFLELVKV